MDLPQESKRRNVRPHLPLDPMRLLALLLLAAASTAASAQTASLRAPAWRASASTGITGASDGRFGRPGDERSGTLSLGAERRVWRPISVGARGAAHSGLAFAGDDSRRAFLRWTTEAFAAGTLRISPRVDLRATLGLGAASISYPIAYVLDPGPGAPHRSNHTETFGTVGVGADVFLRPGVGIGGEVRLVSSLGEPTASEASLGLRIRLP